MRKVDTGKILLGVVLIVIGFLLLAEALGVEMKPIWHVIFKTWPLVFIYIGVKKIIQARESEEITGTEKAQKE